VKPLYPQKLALTSPTGGGRSVGVVRSRTKATEFVCLFVFESVFLALSIQHAKRMRRVVICGLSGCTIFLHIIPLTTRFFGGEKNKIKVIKRDLCFDFLYNFYLKYFSF